MKFFKNTELAKLYYVSEKSVRNWIQASRDGKLELELYEQDDRAFVANTSKNIALIEQLVQKGKKYKNTRGAKALSPKPDFYVLYSQEQILDIISSLTTYHELPLQYSFLNGGATYWDQYSNWLYEGVTPNILTRTIELLNTTAQSVDQQIQSSNKKVNVVDLGPDNGLPIRPTLERLVKQGRLNRYIAIDVSPDMLGILRRNIKEWFGNEVTFSGYVRDFSHARFNDVFLDDYNTFNSKDMPVNLAFVLGSTLGNFRQPERVLRSINESLAPNDLLLYATYLDTPRTRRYFDFKVPGQSPSQKLSFTKMILDRLGIDQSLYDVEGEFNEKSKKRLIYIRPKVDLYIDFRFSKVAHRLELHKNEPIVVWRHWQHDAPDLVELFDESGFDLLQATKSEDRDFILLTSRIKPKFELT
jgi:uncharacterized SAM-dependent methyltransferase